MQNVAAHASTVLFPPPSHGVGKASHWDMMSRRLFRLLVRSCRVMEMIGLRAKRDDSGDSRGLGQDSGLCNYVDYGPALRKAFLLHRWYEFSGFRPIHRITTTEQRIP